jgi:guanylate kinase
MLLLDSLNPQKRQALQALTQDFDPQKPTLVVYSGPSGVGKGVLRNALYTGKSDYGLGYEGKPWQAFQATVSATTRPPRAGEIKGVDYYFLDSDTFRKKVETREFLEFKSSGSGDMYGTPKSEVARIHQLGLLPVLEIETEGKKEIDKLKTDYNILSVFVLPPSSEDKSLKQELSAQVGITLAEQPTLKPLLQALTIPDLSGQITTLYSRLNTRNSENTQKRLLRLAKAVEELQEASHYDVAIVNDTLAEAVPKLQAVFETVYNASQTQTTT